MKQSQKLQTDVRMLIKIAFRNPAEELKQSLWEYWFRSCPPNFSDVELAIWKQIDVVHLFEANSCLLLVTMSVSLWAFFSPHPAYDCIGMVRARKDLCLDGLGDIQIGQQSVNAPAIRIPKIGENVVNPISEERRRIGSGQGGKRMDTKSESTLQFQWQSPKGDKGSSIRQSFQKPTSPKEVTDFVPSRARKNAFDNLQLTIRWPSFSSERFSSILDDSLNRLVDLN